MSNQGTSYKRQIPMERKMELAQYIREENMGNRMKIKQREQIFNGGSEISEPLPETPGSFKVRMLVAVFLFAAFLLCDAGNYQIMGYSTNDFCQLLAKDYLQVDENMEEGEMLTQLSKMLRLDFER